MVPMWIALIAVVVVAVGAVVAKLARRPDGDEVHSVRDYQSVLGTIEQMANRNADGSVRVIGGPDGQGAPASRGKSRSVPPIPPPVVDGGQPGDGVPIVFDDARPKERYGREPVGQVAPAFRSDRARKQAIQSMNHRPRRWVAGTVVAVLVVAFVALAIVGSRHSGHANKGHTASTASNGGHATATTAASPRHSATPTTAVRRGSSSGSGHHGTTKPTTTTTTVPAQIVATSSSSSGQSAVYPVGSTTYLVTVTATGQCWVDATAVATGTTLWTGTLQAGSSQVIQATGRITLELGSPAATLAVSGTPVVFPTPFHTPFIATFEPTATTTGSSTSSSSTTTTVTP